MPGSEYAFNLLEAAAPSLGSIRIRETDILTTDGMVLHGLDEEGQLHLLVPLASGDHPEPDRRSRGVQLVPRVLRAGEEDQPFLDVVCRLPHLNRLFFIVADEMLEEISETPHQAPLACRMVLDRWRELMERPRSSVLGSEALLGLFAELLILDELSQRVPGRAISYWLGPTGHRFDFLAGSHALEVKATGSREGRFVEIHGVLQLEPPAEGSLHLAFVRVEQVPDPGTSILDLVDRIVSRGVSRLELLSRLDQVGFSLTDRDAYERIYFEVLEYLIYGVDSDFPRIIPSSFIGGSVPDGVLGIRYQVDLTGALPQPMMASEMSHLMDTFSGVTAQET